MRHMTCGSQIDMAGKLMIALVLMLLSGARPAVSATRGPGTDETRASMCDQFSGVAFGFCVALCEARECDLQPADDQRCAVLRRGFDRVTGGIQPPC